MRFLSNVGNSHSELLETYRRYRCYLEENRNEIPAEFYAQLVSSWYFDPSDPRSTHDAWLQSCSITSNSASEKPNPTKILLSLLGAFHDRIITYEYTGVIGFSISGSNHHQVDWLLDEIQVMPGNIAHEIQWGDGSIWMITAASVRRFENLEAVPKPLS